MALLAKARIGTSKQLRRLRLESRKCGFEFEHALGPVFLSTSDVDRSSIVLSAPNVLH
jgi:hypothetical protein